MSETAGTIIKLLAALTSPKACVKYITVALFLFVSWKYLEPVISQTKISSEQLSIIILLLGVGAGSLVGHLLSYIFEEVWESQKAKKSAKLKEKEDKKRLEESRMKKEREESRLLERIKTSFEHLYFEQKKTLRQLTLSNKTLEMTELGNSALESNGYIEKLVHVKQATHLVQINPIIKEFVEAQWAAEKESRVSDFIENDARSEKLLTYLEKGNSDTDSEVDYSLLKDLSEYSGCIKGVQDDREASEGFWIYFDDHLLDVFEKKTGKSYLDEVFISINRITEQEATA